MNNNNFFPHYTCCFAPHFDIECVIEWSVMKQEHTRNIQIGHQHILLLSPTYQTTAICVNYMCKNVSNELYCKTADSPQQKCVFPSMLFFSVTWMETSINLTHSVSTIQFDHWITRIKSNLQAGLPWPHLHNMHWWPLTLENEVENNSVLYWRVSCFPCNILFTVIFI